MSPIALDDKALRGPRDIIRQEVQAAMGATSQQKSSQRLESETHPHLPGVPAKGPTDRKTPPNPRGQQDPRLDHSPQPASQPLVAGARRCEKIPKTRKFGNSKT